MTGERILVVEDESITAQDIVMSLQDLEYTVAATVASGEEAIQKAKEEKADLVLMDISLDGKMDGIEAAQQIHSQLNIPVVFLTAYVSSDLIERAKLTEPYGYLVKPFNDRELYGTIEMALYKHETDEKYRSLVENISDVLISTDLEGNITYTSKSFERDTGYSRDEIKGKNLSELLTPESYQVAMERVQKCYEGEGALPPWEVEAKTKDGTLLFFEVSVSFIRQGSRLKEIQFVARNITERKRAEKEKEQLQAQVAQSQKMEAVGTLAAGVAHDFRNLMMVISGYSELLLRRLRDNESLCAYVQEIRKAEERATLLVDQLLAFSRKQILKPEVLNLNNLIANTEKMLRRLVPEDVDFFAVLEPNLKSVKVDAGQIEQVIVNLAVNARDAMPDGGTLSIKTENVVLTEKQCVEIPESRSGEFVCLSVSDTGIGMNEETMSHIFEPFFTTKGPGTGSGLGLCTVYGIVKQHKGWINAYSKPGEGTTFKVYLPSLSAVPEGETSEGVSERDLKGNGERILVVEDEEAVRKLAVATLRDNGYVVVEATSAKEAQDIFDKEKGDFDLLFSDVVLPDRNGVQLAHQLLARKQELLIVLSSGYTDDKSQAGIIRERGFRFLQKPYSLTDLLWVIKEM
ncbi:MAG: response regulator, partial [Chloroflexota bacterium]